jgi:hypothetical protein
MMPMKEIKETLLVGQPHSYKTLFDSDNKVLRENQLE